ncbi:ribosomal protein S19 [Trametopsis cervina]|nr:ribosomal protein S19 [Trametopsis cervina]
MADADVTDPTLAAELKKKRTFRTFSYRGVELDKLLDLSNEEFVELVHARARRRFQRGLKRKPMGLIKKLRKAKKEAPPNEKPAVVKTHLRDMIIVPEMIGSVVGIYNGKVFNTVEIKPEMTGHYLAEFSCSYKPVKHGRPGIGATHCKFPHLQPLSLRKCAWINLSVFAALQHLDSSPSSKRTLRIFVLCVFTCSCLSSFFIIFSARPRLSATHAMCYPRNKSNMQYAYHACLICVSVFDGAQVRCQHVEGAFPPFRDRCGLFSVDSTHLMEGMRTSVIFILPGTFCRS